MVTKIESRLEELKINELSLDSWQYLVDNNLVNTGEVYVISPNDILNLKKQINSLVNANEVSY